MNVLQKFLFRHATAVEITRVVVKELIVMSADHGIGILPPVSQFHPSRRALVPPMATHISAQRGRPLGDEEWVESIARRLNLESTMRPRGRPRESFPKDGGTL